ncbi:MAG: ribonuclease III [Alphaproteobacteria bacterium]|nr:ribonuclease III [Alphaproteobacteria bacterium]
MAPDTKPSRLIDHVEQATGYRFTETKIITTAFTHRSFDTKNNYERLEFFGDRILGFLVAEYLLEHADKTLHEGELNTLQVEAIRTGTLAKVLCDLGLDRQVRHHLHSTPESLFADVCEAMLAAMYLDAQEQGMAVCRQFIHKRWFLDGFLVAQARRDPKSLLQEWAQAKGLPLPVYTVVTRTGGDHAPHFVVKVAVEEEQITYGTGTSKKRAQQDAAATLYLKLTENADSAVAIS